MSTKTIYFSMMVENEENNDEAIWGESIDGSYTDEDIYEMKIEDIKVIYSIILLYILN